MIIEWQRLRQPSHYLRAVSMFGVPRLENRQCVLRFARKANSFARGQVTLLKRGRYAAENRA